MRNIFFPIAITYFLLSMSAILWPPFFRTEYQFPIIFFPVALLAIMKPVRAGIFLGLVFSVANEFIFYWAPGNLLVPFLITAAISKFSDTIFSFPAFLNQSLTVIKIIQYVGIFLLLGIIFSYVHIVTHGVFYSGQDVAGFRTMLSMLWFWVPILLWGVVQLFLTRIIAAPFQRSLYI